MDPLLPHVGRGPARVGHRVQAPPARASPRAVEIVTGIARDLIEGQLDARTAIPTLLELTDVLGLRLGRE